MPFASAWRMQKTPTLSTISGVTFNVSNWAGLRSLLQRVGHRTCDSQRRRNHRVCPPIAVIGNKPLKEVSACPDLSPDFRSAYRQFQSLSLVEMKNEERAKSDQEHLQFRTRRVG
jgi:hypothetical protein